MNILNLGLKELRTIQPFLEDEEGLFYARTWVRMESFRLPRGLVWHVDRENILIEAVRIFNGIEDSTKHL